MVGGPPRLVWTSRAGTWHPLAAILHDKFDARLGGMPAGTPRVGCAPFDPSDPAACGPPLNPRAIEVHPRDGRVKVGVVAVPGESMGTSIQLPVDQPRNQATV